MATEEQLSSLLSEFARTMLTDFPIQSILDHLVQRIVDILPISAAGVTLITPSVGPRYVAASDSSALRYEELQTEMGEGPCLAAYRTGKAVSVPDLRTETRFKQFAPAALEAGLRAAFTFPLHQGARRLGALDLYRDTPGALSKADLITAQTLADVTSAYLLNAQARSELQDSTARSQERAMQDPLTGLPNRALLLERIAHAEKRSRRSAKFLALLFVDLDEFKAVNDAHGHAAGDELLVAVGQRIGAQLRPGDTLARLSGDEFVVLCEELDAESQSGVIAKRILDGLAVPFSLSAVEIKITASVGIAFAGQGDHVPDQLLHDADIAMYQVKRKGGASHQVIDLREQHLAGQRTTMARDLRDAMVRRELQTEYQPIVRMADGRITGAEALLHWDHTAHGEIPPTTIIPIAEQTGLIIEIGRWVLERACADRHKWGRDDTDDPLGVAVNVSAQQLMAPGFTAMVAAVVANTDTTPELLTLEMTESVFVQDAARAVVVLGELSALGVKLALDDFGTGYSSLVYLKDFPIDIIKIDRAFIADITQDPTSDAIVATIVDLCHRLGKVVITEGVETSDQRDALARLGSDSYQGFYFERSLSADQLATLTKPSEEIEPLLLR